MSSNSGTGFQPVSAVGRESKAPPAFRRCIVLYLLCLLTGGIAGFLLSRIIGRRDREDLLRRQLQQAVLDHDYQKGDTPHG